MDRLSSDEGGSQPVAQRRRMHVLDIVDTLADAAAEPTFLAFEDLHWADDLSLEVIGSLARRLADAPLFLVATLRVEEVASNPGLVEWRTRLLTQRLAEEARLARLTLDETAVMARVLLEGRAVSEDAIEAIHERTDGIPLLVEELVGMFADRSMATAEDVRTSGVPETIEATVLERLRHRSTPRRRSPRPAPSSAGGSCHRSSAGSSSCPTSPSPMGSTSSSRTPSSSPPLARARSTSATSCCGTPSTPRSR